MGKRRKRKNRGGASYGAAHHLTHGDVKSMAANASTFCHNGPVSVFRVGRAVVWAGSRMEIRYAAKNWGLVISCLGTLPLPPPVVTMSPLAREMGLVEDVPERAPWLALDWDDGAAPHRLPYGFWKQLAASIATKVEGNVAIFCEGGHGRTGTALAILGSLWGLIPEGDCPVAWVRRHYCKQAVETEAQCEYIQECTGRPVTELGSFDDFSSWYSYGKGEATAQAYDPGKYVSPKASTSTAALSTAGGHAGVPITNAAGDIIAYEYPANYGAEDEGGEDDAG